MGFIPVLIGGLGVDRCAHFDGNERKIEGYSARKRKEGRTHVDFATKTSVRQIIDVET